MTPQQTAELVRDGMFARDRAAQSLAMRITHIAPGEATIEMPVRDDMLNGFDTCHGGYITTLGDTAFAYACNTRNEMTVASGLSIDFLAPAREGDRLTAEAREVSLAGRTGDSRFTAVHGSATDVEEIVRAHGFEHADYVDRKSVV